MGCQGKHSAEFATPRAVLDANKQEHIWKLKPKCGRQTKYIQPGPPAISRYWRRPLAFHYSNRTNLKVGGLPPGTVLLSFGVSKRIFPSNLKS
jgi:hypothetical protein